MAFSAASCRMPLVQERQRSSQDQHPRFGSAQHESRAAVRVFLKRRAPPTSQQSRRRETLQVHARRSGFSRKAVVPAREGSWGCSTSDPGVSESDQDLGWPRDMADNVTVLRSLVLGEGTSGVVTLGVEKSTGLKVAVKAIPKERQGTTRQRMLANIAAEVELLEKVQSCPNVIQLMGKWEDDDFAYVVTELCDEGDLGYLYESMELSELEVAMVAKDILGVLAECHSRNIAHLDVKPENFMVTKRDDGQRAIKAVDFGCSRVVQEGSHLRSTTGTPLYRAPEMYFKTYGLEADLWAAGMIIYQLISGQMCFWGDCLDECTPQSVMDSVLKEDVSFEVPGWEDASPLAMDLVSKLLKRDPKERINATDALRHEWITMHCGEPSSRSTPDLQHYASNVVPRPSTPNLRVVDQKQAAPRSLSDQ